MKLISNLIIHPFCSDNKVFVEQSLLITLDWNILVSKQSGVDWLPRGHMAFKYMLPL